MYISASAPDAPALSDTTIGCFIRPFFWIAACIIRAIWSEAPPAPAATTISTGLVGSQPATAGAIARTAVSAAAALMICRTCFPRIFFRSRAMPDINCWIIRAIVRVYDREFKPVVAALLNGAAGVYGHLGRGGEGRARLAGPARTGAGWSNPHQNSAVIATHTIRTSWGWMVTPACTCASACSAAVVPLALK